MTRCLSLFLVVFVAAPLAAADRPDILVADFEGDTYPNGWKTTGTAFGQGPAKGTLPNQMPVTGFLGKGLVNSYLGGDSSTGTLTSPPFKLERNYLNFLVGGGKHKNKTCVNILIDGKVVHSVTGPNDRPGGSEHLEWHSWEIPKQHQDQEAVIQIVDEETGGWGHINADHFILSDKKKQAQQMARTLVIDQRYVHLPVKNGVPVRRVVFAIGPDIVREFDIELADGIEPDFWVFADVSAFRGKPLVVRSTLPPDSQALSTLKQADDVPDAEKLYREKHRPLFHFTSRRGWLNDPNGLVYHDGEWHLFYQHNPYGREWGNMHWGHAVSRDLVRWNELGIALYPKKYGDWAFSGSAVVDHGNTSGWGTKEKPPLVLAYTSTGRGECIAYSTDRGRTWTEYDQNPVVKHQGRDPKLVWYAKGKHWVMAVYDEHDNKQWIAFYTSPDLKTWTFASRIQGFYECPDLFELPTPWLEANLKDKSRWVLYAADGQYLLGDFDGQVFKPDFQQKKRLWHGRFYAAQTFDSAPAVSGGAPRRIQIGWGQGITFPGMPFNQQMTVPVELRLRAGEPGEPLRMTARPVDELTTLTEPKPVFATQPRETVAVAAARVLADDLDAFQAVMTVDIRKAAGFTLDLRGTKLVYDAAKKTLTCKDVTATVDHRQRPLLLTVLVDRGSVEVFADDGLVAMSVAAVPDEKNRKLELIPHGGEITIQGVRVNRMKSAWDK